MIHVFSAWFTGGLLREAEKQMEKFINSWRMRQIIE